MLETCIKKLKNMITIAINVVKFEEHLFWCKYINLKSLEFFYLGGGHIGTIVLVSTQLSCTPRSICTFYGNFLSLSKDHSAL